MARPPMIRPAFRLLVASTETGANCDSPRPARRARPGLEPMESRLPPALSLNASSAAVTPLAGSNGPNPVLFDVNVDPAHDSTDGGGGVGGIGANLLGADLSDADLSGANLRDADLGYTVITNVDLSEVRGLDAVKHWDPSSVGIDTLFHSRGKIPAEFLRGCGVPDQWITYLPSLVGMLAPIQFYSCFISYSTKDEDFAQRLHSRMHEKGLRVWYSPKDIKGGQKLHEQIDQAIRGYEKLLLVLSPNSMNSEWVKTEIRKARKIEIKEGQQKLFPIRLVDFEVIRDWECFDADSGKDLGVEIREYFIPDFTNWMDHDAFEKAFDRLLDDLKPEEMNPPEKTHEQ